MNSIKVLKPAQYPALLQQVSDLPERLYIKGELPDDNHVFLTVVGSRKYTEYGKIVTEMLIKSLAGMPVVIVSGLAYGIDTIAHRTALSVGLRTIAIPGSGLSDDILYPASNRTLAEQIVKNHGALISMFENNTAGAPWMFPHRNRIMAGISHATLVIEAEIRSGTLITSKHATEFNRNVLTVPGSIFSLQSAGPHMLIKLGATPITIGTDLIEALGFKVKEKQKTLDLKDFSEREVRIVQAIKEPISRDDLITMLSLPASEVNTLISLLEIKGVLEEKLSKFYLV